jgi:hypothetical protein
MNTLNKQSFSSPFAQTYNSVNDIKFRHNLDGVMLTSTQGITEPVAPQLPRHSQRKVVKRNATKKLTSSSPFTSSLLSTSPSSSSLLSSSSSS